MAAAVPIAALALSAATTGYQVSQQRRAQKEAEKESKAAAQRERTLLTGLEREEEAGQQRAAARIGARRRKSRTGPRRGGTILTGPLGIAGEPDLGGGKTLLGE
jgi:hypothetical protein